MSTKTKSKVIAVRDIVSLQEDGLLILRPIFNGRNRTFQRETWWDNGRKVLLAYSVIQETTVPPIYGYYTDVAGTMKKALNIIDGQQRISSILDFVNSKYKINPLAMERYLLEEEIAAIDPEIVGKFYYQMPPAVKRKIENYEFRLEFYENEIDETEAKVLFHRINVTQTSAPTKMEIFNNQYSGDFMNLVHDCREWLGYDAEKVRKNNKYYLAVNKIVTVKECKRMKDCSLILQLLSLSHYKRCHSKSEGLEELCRLYKENMPENVDRNLIDKFSRNVDTIKFLLPNIVDAIYSFRRKNVFYSLYFAIDTAYNMGIIKTPDQLELLDLQNALFQFYKRINILHDLKQKEGLAALNAAATSEESEFVIKKDYEPYSAKTREYVAEYLLQIIMNTMGKGKKRV